MKDKVKQLFCIAMVMILMTSMFLPTEKAYAAAESRAGSSAKIQTPVLTNLFEENDLIGVSWNPVKDVAGYVVYRKIDSSSWKKVTTITSNSTYVYFDKDVKVGYTYSYTVKAYKKINGKNVYSSYDKKGKSGKLSTRVSGFVPKKGTATINWVKTTGASGYYIYRAANKNGKYEKIKAIADGDTLSYTNTGLKNGTYYYKVTPYGLINGKKILGSSSEPKEIKISNSSIFSLHGIENIDCWICESVSCSHSVVLPEIGMDAEILTNSNPSVADVSGIAWLLNVSPKRTGSTSVTFKYGGKTWKSKINVYKWENPCKTFKLEGKDYSGIFKNKNVYNQYRKKNIKTKIQIVPKSGWKLSKIEKLHDGVSTTVKNNSTIELSLAMTGSAVDAYFKNLATGVEEKLTLGFGYGEGEFFGMTGIHTETRIK